MTHYVAGNDLEFLILLSQVLGLQACPTITGFTDWNYTDGIQLY